MPVATEAAYAERSWTGVETSFSPGFTALDPSFVVVQYQSFDGALSTLTRGVHFNSTLGAGNAMTVTPLALPAASPAAPGLLLIARSTPATQGVDFVNLNAYDPAVHTGIADRLTMIAAELKDKVRRFLLPFSNVAGVLDFRPYRIKAADPVDDADLATKLYVLTVTGILNLQSYVTQCAASAAAAAASALSALGYETAALAARDKAQAWSDTAENTPVQGSEYSAFHWSRKAQAYAASVLSLLNNPDDGIFGDVESGPIDDGVF